MDVTAAGNGEGATTPAQAGDSAKKEKKPKPEQHRGGEGSTQDDGHKKKQDDGSTQKDGHKKDDGHKKKHKMYQDTKNQPGKHDGKHGKHDGKHGKHGKFDGKPGKHGDKGGDDKPFFRKKNPAASVLPAGRLAAYNLV